MGFFIQQVTGHLDDCTCDVETIDAFNNYKLFPRLNELLQSDYFRYYKVIFLIQELYLFCVLLLFFSAFFFSLSPQSLLKLLLVFLKSATYILILIF